MTVIEFGRLVEGLEESLGRCVQRVPAVAGSDHVVRDVLTELLELHSHHSAKFVTREGFRVLGRRYSELRGTREGLNDLVLDQISRGGDTTIIADLFGIPKKDVEALARGRKR